jgi:dTDP-4-amino-4,6-dideoxygalactose transaminase/predicted dehydrogenase
MDALFEFLMRQAKSHGGRVLYDARELKLVREALLTQNLFGMDGYMVNHFEKEFAEMYGVPYAVASTSGTAAIHTALGALDIDGGSEVITAPITDLGTIIPILYQNLIPVFADVDASYQMDPEDVERKITLRTKAIIAVHLFGNACDMRRMTAVAKKHDIPLIEDCSQAHLTEYQGKFVGTWGDIGCYSFQQSKHMTTGDGGMTITPHKAYYERMKLFVDKGYARKGWGSRAYLFHAPNYRMNELTAAVGRAQLKKVQAVVQKRQAMGERMTELLRGIQGLTTAPVTDGARHSFWLYPFKLEGVNVAEFCQAMIKKGVYAMAGYTGKTIYLCTESLTAKKTYGNSQLPFTARNVEKVYEYKEGLCPKAEKSLETLVCVPWNESWGDEGVKRAADVIKTCLEKMTGMTLRGEAGQPNVIARSPQGDEAISATKIASGTASPRNDTKINIAIIGCGQIGRNHLDSYRRNPKVRIVACADTDSSRAEAFAKEVGARSYVSHRELIQNEKLQGVSICTVPSTHREIAVDFLEAGVHVLCEKPLALSVRDAQTMLQKAKETNRILLTAFKLRFFEEVQKAKELIAQGTLGKILNFRLMFGGYMDMDGTWFVKKEISGGGVIMDNGPHAADLIQHLFGDIENVLAKAVDAKNVGVEDTAKITFSLRDGLTGTVDVSWAAWVTPSAYLEIYGTDGTLLLDGTGVTLKYKTWNEWKKILNKTTVADGFASQINHFVETIQNNKTTIIDAEAGLKAQKVIEAAYRSIEQKTSVNIG